MKSSRANTRTLTSKTEAWLRERIPGWGDMRDRAVAAGLADPALPMSEAQAEKVEAIVARVRRRLHVSGGSRGSDHQEEE